MSQFAQFLHNGKYKYKLFDTAELLELIIHDKPFIRLLENAIQIYRNSNRFAITDLITEYINEKSNGFTKYSVIYTKNKIVSTCRFIYTKKLGYFNMVYTNAEYRNKKICQTHIQHLIDLDKTLINKPQGANRTYELHVLKNNIPAIKCYENIGFKKIEQSSRVKNLLGNKNNYLMRLKI